jgi:hypothetical protein
MTLRLSVVKPLKMIPKKKDPVAATHAKLVRASESSGINLVLFKD